MIRVVHPGSRIRMLTLSHPGSRGQKGTQSRIPDPDPQHCFSHIIARNLFFNTGMPKKAWIISWDTPLLVGTMVEWGNYWAKAIRMRDYKQTEAYAGMFSQIGELYNVKVWYKSHPTSPNLIPSCGQVSFHHVAKSHSIM